MQIGKYHLTQTSKGWQVSDGLYTVKIKSKENRIKDKSPLFLTSVRGVFLAVVYPTFPNQSLEINKLEGSYLAQIGKKHYNLHFKNRIVLVTETNKRKKTELLKRHYLKFYKGITHNIKPIIKK